MRKKAIIIPAALLIVLGIFVSVKVLAQSNGKNPMAHHMMKHRMAFLSDLSVDQMAALQTKRMTFYLDLSDAQIQQVTSINQQVAKLRKYKMKMFGDLAKKPDNAQMYELMNERLDHQIKFKKELKLILSEKQMEKLEMMMAKSTPFGKPGPAFMFTRE